MLMNVGIGLAFFGASGPKRKNTGILPRFSLPEFLPGVKIVEIFYFTI